MTYFDEGHCELLSKDSSPKTVCERWMWELQRRNKMTENGICHYCLYDISGYFLFSISSQLLCLKRQPRMSKLTPRFQSPPPVLLKLPPQNHRAAYDIEQSCHPRQPVSHYSCRIYPSMLRRSAFIRPFYRRPLGSLLGMDSISCAVIIKS